MANVTRYTPVDDLFNELTRGFFVRPLGMPREAELQIKLEVKEDEKAYRIRAEIPGVKKEDIHVDIQGSRVGLRAEVKREKEDKQDEKVICRECTYGTVSRGFDLPDEVDAERARAEYRDGILSLTLPKKAGAGTRRINIS
jgi:HSP20 family protein